MNTAACTPDVRGPSPGENEVVGEPSPGAPGLAEATAEGAEPGRSRGSARPATGRDAKGRFGPGKLGGPGNPFARQLAKFRAFIMNCNTEAHMLLAFNKMMELIADGNLGALLYILGKPADAVDPDKFDLDEWDGYRRPRA